MAAVDTQETLGAGGGDGGVEVDPPSANEPAEMEPVAVPVVIPEQTPNRWDDDEGENGTQTADKPSVARRLVSACGSTFMLYVFNVVAVLISTIVVAGQVAVHDQIDFRSPELIVLGGTVVALGILATMGLYGMRNSSQQVLRFYTFGLLVLVMMQMSILAVLVENIESPNSSFVQQFATLLGPICEATAGMEMLLLINEGEDSSGSEIGIDRLQDGSATGWLHGANDVQDGLLGQICRCLEVDATELQSCLQSFLSMQMTRLVITMLAVWAFELTLAAIAYRLVDSWDKTSDPSVRITKRPAREEVVLDMEALLDPVKGTTALFTLIRHKLEDMRDSAHREAVILTNTWYFEAAVLFASFTNFLVMATSSKAVPPSVNMLSAIMIGEIFCTLFLTFEVSIDVVFKMTKAEFLHMHRNPWICVDIFVLSISWLYLYNPDTAFSVGRVLRVLRPLRTLRMLSDIKVVMDTMVEAVPLFGQACLLVSFMLTAYSLVGMSLWAGGLRYQCALSEEEAYALLTMNITTSDAIDCPAALVCGGAETCSLRDPPSHIRSENFGFTGFDSFQQSFLTMFVQMTGDNGMQDIPFALDNAGVNMSSAGWIVMSTAVVVLTTTALNLFLAVCCSVFDDVMGKISDRQRAALDRELKMGLEITADEADENEEDPLDGEQVEARSAGTGNTFGLKKLRKQIGKATKNAAENAKLQAEKARKALKPSDVLQLDYEQRIRTHDWTKTDSKCGRFRNMCKRIVLAPACNFTINILIGVNAIILCSNHHGQSQEWKNWNTLVEGICLVIYWFEFSGKVLGYGFGTYMSESMNKMDTFVLVACSTGFVQDFVTFLAVLIPSLNSVGEGLTAFNSIRIVKLLRALQMSRWIMKHDELKQILQTVFKSWESIVLIAIFAIFSMVCFAVVAMNVFGGGLGEYPEVTIEDYPRRNVETFSNAFFQSCMFITGEAWSTTMYWYMEHSGSPRYLVAFFFVAMFTWLNCVIFSLFVAVLLINFSIDEDEMLPKQRVKYELEQSLKHTPGSKLMRLLRKQDENFGDVKEMHHKATSYDLFVEANLVKASMSKSIDARVENGDEESSSTRPRLDPPQANGRTKNGQDDDCELQLSERVLGGEAVGPAPLSKTRSVDDDEEGKSLGTFGIDHPFRLRCAFIESHPWFESLVTYLVLTSCLIIALEDPSNQRKYQIFFDTFNLSLLITFIAEMLIKVVVHGWRKKCGPTQPYLATKTNQLDLFVIVAISTTYALPLVGLDGGEGSSLSRMLRLVRILAPLLELVRKDEISSLFRTFWLALPAIGAVVFLLAILLTMFGIVGVEFFAGKLYRCVHAEVSPRCDADWRYMNKPLSPEVPPYCHDGLMATSPVELYSWDEVRNKTDCETRKFDCVNGAGPRDCALWLNPPFNFDNIFYAMMSLFYLATCAGWVDIMETTMDITGVDQSPKLDSFVESQIYYLFFTIVFSTFMLNLFIGVLGNAFSETAGTNLITPSQTKWIRACAMLKTYSPDEPPPNRPETGVLGWRIRQYMYDLSMIDWLDKIWTAGILVNVAVLLSDHFPTDPAWDLFVAGVNLVCLLVFTAEFVMKLIGYGFTAFLENRWQRLDLFVIIGSWGSMFVGMKAGAGVIRAFRTIRLALLVKRMPGLMSLIDTVIACISPSVSICAISALFFYVYAILGMKLFGDGEIENIGGYDNDFETFLSSLTLLFQMVNGQTLYVILWDMREHGEILPFIYACSFYFILVYLCMNLLIVAVLENFGILASLDEDHFEPEDLDVFMETWHKLTYETIHDIPEGQIANSIDKLHPRMTETELQNFAALKVAQEDSLRLNQWAQFRRRFPKQPYLEQLNPMFDGWIRMSANKQYFFWVEDDMQKEEGGAGHRYLNWFSEGNSDDALQEAFEKKGHLVVNRVCITAVRTELPPEGEKMNSGFAVEAGGAVGGMTRLQAALTGQTWLLSIVNCVRNHPKNITCRLFEFDYYDISLNDGDCVAPQDAETMNLTSAIRDVVLEEDLTALQLRFRQCIRIGYEIPDCYTGCTSSCGCIVCDPNDISDFWPFFAKVLQEIHGADLVSIDDQQPVNHMQDWTLEKVRIVLSVTFPNDVTSFTSPESPRSLLQGRGTSQGHASPGTASPKQIDESMDVKHLELSRVNCDPLYMCLSAVRNIQGFTMVATMSVEERMACEDVLELSIQKLIADPDWAGKYVSLTPGHPDEISLAEYKQYVEDGLMFPPSPNDPRMVVSGQAQHWPYGRGAYISADEMTTIWVGCGDHVVVNARDPETQYVDLVFERLRVSTQYIESNEAVEFRRDERCGFINSMPLHAGTGMQAVASISCPNLTHDGTADLVNQIIREEDLDLEVRPVPVRSWYPCCECNEVGADGTVQVALVRTYGVTEKWIVQKLYKSISRLNEVNERYVSQARSWTKHKEKRDTEIKALAKRFQEVEEHARDKADMHKVGVNDLAIEFDIEIVDAMVLTDEQHKAKFGHKKEESGAVPTSITLYADSEEQYRSWLVVLHWLADNCAGPSPTGDPRMATGRIAPRRLTQDEWATMSSVKGLIDLPFSSLRNLFSMLQKKGVLGMRDSHDRCYRLYATFQMELYAYQTQLSDRMRTDFKIDGLLQSCSGLNYRQVLSTLCLLNYGKVDCLPYAESMDAYIMETQLVALRLIQTALGEWVARRSWQKNPEVHPSGVMASFWHRHSVTYLVALRAARDARLRTLKLLMKMVRRTRPTAMTMEELRKSKQLKGMLPTTDSDVPREMEWTFGDGEQKEGPPDIRSENGIGGLGASAADAAMDMLMPPPVDEYTNPLGNRQSSPTLSESQTGGLGEIDPAAGSIDDV